MLKKNIEMYRGDTHAFGFRVKEWVDGTITPMENLSSAYFSCKRTKDDDAYVFQKTLGDGISAVTSSVYRVRIAPEDTNSVEPGTYAYDLQVGVNGDIYTIMAGDLEILPDVTR